MPLTKEKAFFSGLKASIPIMIGYLPVAVTFGVITVQAGLSPVTAILLSVIMFSGAAQFMFIAMFASGLPLGFTVALSLLLNFRHLFYGPTLAPYLPHSPKTLAIVSFALTDEVFAMAHGLIAKIPYHSRLGWFAGLGSGSYLSWVGGTAIGALSGQLIMNWSELAVNSMQIALPALFFLLILPHIKTELKYALLGSFTVAATASWFGQTAIGIIAAGITGTILFTGQRKWKQQ